MALQTSGQISLLDVRTELKKDGKISLDDSDVRKLAEKESGEIKFSDFYGKSSIPKEPYIITLTIQCGLKGAIYGYMHDKLGIIKSMDLPKKANPIKNIYLEIKGGYPHIFLQLFPINGFKNVEIDMKTENTLGELLRIIEIDDAPQFYNKDKMLPNNLKVADIFWEAVYSKKYIELVVHVF